ncbi:MAG TPA: hypothetical protein VNU92_09975 [Edaphobacter sp.]|nr:hypothetical protein [Edaphobacter sp.]
MSPGRRRMTVTVAISFPASRLINSVISVTVHLLTPNDWGGDTESPISGMSGGSFDS